MSAVLPPRLHERIREAIRQRLADQGPAAPVQVSRILRDVRSETDTSQIADDDLVRQIVLDATDRGLSVHFDRENQ